MSNSLTETESCFDATAYITSDSSDRGGPEFDVTSNLVVNVERIGSAESRRWRPAPDTADSEYTTYSESEIKVYKDDRLISSTDNGVTSTDLQY